jgi:hypothetical protein
MRKVVRPLLSSDELWKMDELIIKRDYKAAFELIVQELEEDPESKEELKELFAFVLETYR